jgi:hypothetical protein
MAVARRFHESELAGTPKDDDARAQAEIRQKGLVLTDYHPRPSFGSAGQRIDVLANFFQVRFAGKEGKMIYHYDVDIVPVIRETPGRKPPPKDRGPAKLPILLLREVIERCAAELDPSFKPSFDAGAYDGRKNLFTPVKFPIGNNESKHIRVVVPDKDPRPPRPGQEPQEGPQGRRFDVTFKYASDINLEAVAEFCRGKKQSTQVEQSMLTAIMAVNVLLRDDVGSFEYRTYKLLTSLLAYGQVHTRRCPAESLVHDATDQQSTYVSYHLLSLHPNLTLILSQHPSKSSAKEVSSVKDSCSTSFRHPHAKPHLTISSSQIVPTRFRIPRYQPRYGVLCVLAAWLDD